MAPSSSTSRATLPHSSRWLAVASLLSLSLLLGLVGCGGDEPFDLADERTDEEGHADVTASDPMEGLQLTLGLERLDFEPGERITVSMELANWSDERRTLSFRTTQRFDILLLDEAGEEIARWSEDQVFGQALGEEVLEPESDGPQWTAEWHAPDSPGSYQLEAVILPAEGELRMGVPIEVR